MKESIRKNLIIGIDPDVYKNGVAIYNQEEQVLRLRCLKFFDLYQYLWNNQESIKLVIIEAGYLNKGNWHKVKGSPSINSKIGERTGANFEVSKKIVEMCDFLNIPFKEIKPLSKIWKGANKKVTAEEFEKITGIKGRTNQEMRDAGLIALTYKDAK